MCTIRPIFYDQCSLSLTSLSDVKEGDIVFMCELKEEATYIRHHPKKIALWFAAMRHFAKELHQSGIRVRYITLNDQDNTHSFTSELERMIAAHNVTRIIVTEPSEYRLIKMVQSWQEMFSILVEVRTDDRFFCSIEEFKVWAKNKTQLRMEYFYREMRKKFNILIEDDKSPTGGEWNYDKENRKSPNNDIQPPKRIIHEQSSIVKDVLKLVKEHFSDHFGMLEPFDCAVSREQALSELDHFIEHILPYFGEYQDVMLTREPYLFHSVLSAYINLGLLLPKEICVKAEDAYRTKKAPLNAVEGFIRQILGWREFVRGIYHLHMPAYAEFNHLDANHPLPSFYWGKKTDMHCVSEAVLHTHQYAYSHHIQRLMVTGNYALIAGLDVKEVQEWYLAVYIDAYEWVEMPNTLGMALFGDGGIIASKPYAASGQYINKMSNFCKSCRYNVKETIGPNACPLNSLYWDFIERNRLKLEHNPRISMMYKTWDRFDADKQAAIKAQAADVIERMQQDRL
ncbi:MAG: cryptochrome/photolyase family protein [Gammaproteobacteria bacterium]|nr:cryptochrome/photolyase family protein [Gammaproteobacteria bacterium]